MRACWRLSGSCWAVVVGQVRVLVEKETEDGVGVGCLLQAVCYLLLRASCGGDGGGRQNQKRWL